MRKFLGHTEDDVAIYDEARRSNGSKNQDKYINGPSEKQIINSRGERLCSDSDDAIEIAPEGSDRDEQIDLKQD